MSSIDPQKIDFWIRKRGLKRYQLTDAIQEHKTNYSQWISGKRRIHPSRYQMIADFLRVPLQELLNDNVPEDVIRDHAVPVVAFQNTIHYLPFNGSLADFVSQYQEEKLLFPTAEAGDFVVKIDNGAYAPEYPRGTYLLIRPSLIPCDGCKILAKLNHGGVLAATFHIDTEHQKLNLKSLNPLDKNPYRFTVRENIAFWIWVVTSILRSELPPVQERQYTQNFPPLTYKVAEHSTFE